MLEIADALQTLGFSKLDVALLTLCPLFAVLGSFVHMFMVENDFSRMPEINEERHVVDRINHSIFSLRNWVDLLNQKRWYWIWGRLIIGLAVGILVGLYFVGAINPGAANSAKVLALALLAGYLAPKLFIAQDNAVTAALEKKLPAIIEEAIEKHKKSSNET